MTTISGNIEKDLKQMLNDYNIREEAEIEKNALTTFYNEWANKTINELLSSEAKTRKGCF